MGDDSKEALKPIAYAGTVKVSVRGKDHYVHISAPPMGATLEELGKALENNRELIDTSQSLMQQAVVDQIYLFKPPMQVNFDSPTQDAIMAHLHINILIPLINIRGGTATFAKAETLHVQQRVEIMRSAAERMAHMERQTSYNPLPNAVVAVVVLSTVIFALFIN